MYLDVRDLRDFYYRSALGRVAQRVIRKQMLSFWPDADRQNVAGFGFATPLLRPYLPQARRVMTLMPAPQGVMPWPAGLPNVSLLCEETRWPLDTGHLDRLVLMHGLETSERVGDLLDECYRVLGPGGEMLVIVPNRSGLWAQSDRTPFGYGRPYSRAQLELQLKLHDFIPRAHVSVLYQPPSPRRFWMKTAPFWERLGRAVPGLSGGVSMMLVAKRTPPTRRGLEQRAHVLNPLDVLTPRPVTEPKPV